MSSEARPPTWSSFCKTSNGQPPRKLLLEAVKYTNLAGKALDLGAGALNETRYLLEAGFEVTAVDSEPLSAKAASTIHSSKLHFEAASFQNFNFPMEEYDLAAAIYALPFAPPENFNDVVKNLLDSIKPDGIFTGNFFGKKDEWNNGVNQVNFIDKKELSVLLSGYSILSLEEELGEGETSTGGIKYWHVYHVIARKKRLTAKRL